MEKKFIRVSSVKDIAISVSLLAIGLALAFLPQSNDIQLGGYTLIALGILSAFILKSEYKDTQTGEKYLHKEFMFATEKKAAVLAAITDHPASLPLSAQGQGQGLRLEIHYGLTSGKAYLQLFEYVPHQYRPCSEVHEHEINQLKGWLE